MPDCVRALKEWTGKANTTIIYDSTVDEFTNGGLFDRLKGKRNIAVVGFTTKGDVFGGFYSVAVTEQCQDFNDTNIFVFSFESRGRCETPQRFMVEEGFKENAYVSFWNVCYGFVGFWVDGVCGFYLGNEESNSYCCDMSEGFKGLQDTTLTGKNGTWREGPFHFCTRLVAIQLS